MGRREPRKKSFLVYYDNYEKIAKRLNDEQLGRWFRMIADYEIYGTIPEASDNDVLISYMVDEAISVLDRDLEKFRKRCETNRENIKKYWDEMSLDERIEVAKTNRNQS